MFRGQTHRKEVMKYVFGLCSGVQMKVRSSDDNVHQIHDTLVSVPVRY